MKYVKYFLCFLLSFFIFYLLAKHWPLLFGILIICFIAGPFLGGIPLAGPFEKMKPHVLPCLLPIYLSIGVFFLIVILGYGPPIGL